MRGWGLGLCLILMVWCGAGCQFLEAIMPAENAPATTTVLLPPGKIPDWSSQAVGIDRLDINFSTSTASRVVIYRIALKNHRFSFEHATATASVAEWLGRLSDAELVINGVYFQENYLPSGWLKVHDQLIGQRQFDVDRSALLTLQPEVAIVTGNQVPHAKNTATDAAQSYPMLVEDGAPLVKDESGKVARRTFVGVDRTHEYLYLGVVPYTSISLYELSHFLAKLPIHWKTVLNLDGGPSSGLAFRNASVSETIDSYVTVPNVLVVRTKAQ